MNSQTRLQYKKGGHRQFDFVRLVLCKKLYGINSRPTNYSNIFVLVSQDEISRKPVVKPINPYAIISAYSQI